MKHTWCFCNIRIDILKELDTVGRFLDYKNILKLKSWMDSYLKKLLLYHILHYDNNKFVTKLITLLRDLKFSPRCTANGVYKFSTGKMHSLITGIV